ncbi:MULTISPECIES: hypothetical protein [unclassified Microcoleus]|uniref:hypothetical protein n=1 Tax=unclassified Microcoleus TaxID=2642155 RepID=UPI002FD0725F
MQCKSIPHAPTLLHRLCDRTLPHPTAIIRRGKSIALHPSLNLLLTLLTDFSVS